MVFLFVRVDSGFGQKRHRNGEKGIDVHRAVLYIPARPLTH